MIRRLVVPLLLAGLLGACTGAETQDDYADAMGREHAGETPANAAAGTDLGAEPRGEVKGEMITYATVDGKPVQGYLARPAQPNANGPLPAVILVHEWWGLNDNIKRMARHLAAEGYQALAIDLYGGASAATPEEAKAAMQKSMENLGANIDNVTQAHAFLQEKEGAPKVGVIGWCFGGGWSLRTALVLGPGIQAAVVYYGQVTADPNELGGLEAPVLGIFGEADKGIPVESAKAFKAAADGLQKDVTLEIFPGADHAFANPSGQHYDAPAAMKAWKMTTEFFAKHLK